MKKRDGCKIIALVLTLSIIIALLLTGPAQAYNLGLSIFDADIDKGKKVSFTASVEIGTGEFLEIDYLILKLKGPLNINCKFNVNGSIIQGCSGMSIIQVSSLPYNYGYGFTGGNLIYNITLDTADYFAGTYATYLAMVIRKETFEKQGKDIIIRAIVEELKKCSVRADKGSLNIEEQNFGNNNHLSFYIPKNNAAAGQGSLTAQFERTRFSYSFDVKKILENNKNYAVILVSGKYRIGLEEEKAEDAIIFFDKLINKINLTGENINLAGSKVSLSEYC